MIDCEKHLYTNEMAENNINDKIECNFILKNGNIFIDNTAEIQSCPITQSGDYYFFMKFQQKMIKKILF